MCVCVLAESKTRIRQYLLFCLCQRGWAAHSARWEVLIQFKPSLASFLCDPLYRSHPCSHTLTHRIKMESRQGCSTGILMPYEVR